MFVALDECGLSEQREKVKNQCKQFRRKTDPGRRQTYQRDLRTTAERGEHHMLDR